MWTILKVFIEFVTMLLLFFMSLVFWPRGKWDLSFLTRAGTVTPALESKILTTGPPGKSPQYVFFCIKLLSLSLVCLRFIHVVTSILGFPGGSDGKESACNIGDLGLIPGLGRSPGEGNGNPLQYSCLENSVDRGAWHAAVHGVTESDTT